MIYAKAATYKNIESEMGVKKILTFELIIFDDVGSWRCYYEEILPFINYYIDWILAL